MKEKRKRVTVTLPGDLLDRVDKAVAREEGASRSEIVERWLRGGARGEREREIERQTREYYESLTADERRENDAMTRAFAASARKVNIDDAQPSLTRKRAAR